MKSKTIRGWSLIHTWTSLICTLFLLLLALTGLPLIFHHELEHLLGDAPELREMPAGIGYEWSGLSLQEQESGGQAPILYGLSILVVFLLLAALYESWTIPVPVLLGRRRA